MGRRSEGCPQDRRRDLTGGWQVARVEGSEWRGTSAMLNVERCRERSEECKRKAEMVSDARDRAKWLELADGWIGLSRMPSHTGPKAHFPRIPHSGFWRGSGLPDFH
jgi:hypothetical protein